MEDFIDVIRETVPQMIEQVHQGIKRDHSEVSSSDSAPSSPSEPATHRARTSEVLSVQHLSVDSWSTEGLDIEALIDRKSVV